MRALDEVVTSGRARFVGVSNFTSAMLAECMRTRRVDVSQVGYHMLDRRQEEETFPYCVTHGIGVMGYGSLGHGLLTGAFTAATAFDTRRDWRAGGIAFGQPIFRGDNFKTNVAVAERLRREVAQPRGVPLSQIALAWVLGNPPISTALVGARTPAEVDANDAGAELVLTPAERATIDEILRGVAGGCASSPPCGPRWSLGARSCLRPPRRKGPPLSAPRGLGTRLGRRGHGRAVQEGRPRDQPREPGSAPPRWGRVAGRRGLTRSSAGRAPSPAPSTGYAVPRAALPGSGRSA